MDVSGTPSVEGRIVDVRWTNCVSVTHKFTFDDLADGAIGDRFKRTMSDPERSLPGVTRKKVTERAATTFAKCWARD